MKLKSLTGVDPNILKQQVDQLSDAKQAVVNHAQKAHRGAPVVPVEPPKGAASLEAKLLLDEIASPDSPIDWAQFPNLRAATADEVQVAKEYANNVGQVLQYFRQVEGCVRTLAKEPDEDVTTLKGANTEYGFRKGIVAEIGLLKKAIESAGPCAAVSRMPVEMLNQLETNLTKDVEGMEALHGNQLRQPASRSSFQPGASYRPREYKTPSADQLPETKMPTADGLKKVDVLAKSLADSLKWPEVEAKVQVLKGARDVKSTKMKTLLKAVALLADEAVHAPDYSGHSRTNILHKQIYRARKHGEASSNRQTESRGELRAGLSKALASEDPVKALEKFLVSGFLKEIGVSQRETAHWKPTGEAVSKALFGETFVPLRAFNERIERSMMGRAEGREAKALVLDMTQSVVEGNYHEWRMTHPASAEQLAVLSEAQNTAWSANCSIESKIPGTDVKLKTTEAHQEGFELMWATKVGAKSHGFDTMTQCALSLVTNARNTCVMVKDPRWPGFSGRAYLRLFSRPETGKPVLFLESMSLCALYPDKDQAIREAVIKHGVAKAKELGVELSISGSCTDLIKDLDLPGQFEDARYRLGPSAMVEAASVFGIHDWVQKKPEIRRMRRPQFFYDLNA